MKWWQKEEQNDEVATSPELWRPISRHVGGFDLDPAAGAESAPIATTRYTRADDGLAKPWFGTVWLNPPFSEKTPWFRRLVSQYKSGAVDEAVAVAPVTTSSKWFHNWFARADTLCFLDERNWFNQGDNPSFSTVIGVWGATSALRGWLESMGTVTHPALPSGQQTLSEVTR